MAADAWDRKERSLYAKPVNAFTSQTVATVSLSTAPTSRALGS